jgi:P-type Cu+ transporter
MEEVGIMSTDFICGMSVDERKAETFDYKGHTFYFCGEGCKGRFAKSPEKFLKARKNSVY